MADIVLQRDVSSLGSLLRLAPPISASGGPGATGTGSVLDRLGSFLGSIPNSLLLGVVWGATLATGKPVSIGYNVQTSDDGVSWTDFASNASVVGTGSTGASVLSGLMNAGLDLTYARRYIRVSTSMTTSGTDTSIGQAVGMFAGFDRLPQ